MTELNSLLKDYRKSLAENELNYYYISIENIEGERVSHSTRMHDPLPIYSATKSISSLAMGLAEDEGILKRDELVLDIFPEFSELAAKNQENLKLEHLMTMNSGKHSFRYSALNEEAKKGDWAELYLRLPCRHEPGERFFYSNSDVYMATRSLQKRAGESLRAFLLPRLFYPLGIYSPIWGTCPKDYTDGASKLFLYPEEFSRIAQLFLHRGAYEGKQLIPRGYFLDATSKLVDSESIAGFKHMAEEDKDEMKQGYGYWFWRGAADSFRADGKYGQFIVVFPKQDLVLTILGHEEKRPYQLLRVFENLIL